jgi:hypothetical protein
MKRCPQCNNVFEDALLYCPTDGTPLIAEEFAVPSNFAPADEEEITVIRSEPLTIDIPQASVPTEQFKNPALPQTVVPVIVERRRNTGKYLAFLLTGLLLGGGLVLAALFFAKNFGANKTTEITVNANQDTPPSSNKNVKAAPTEIPKTPDPKHARRTDTDDDEFNGRVISSNAFVRSSPNRNSATVDVLPVDDRLTIINRENDNSPWFFVTCEHGTNGWMHGNMIEYTR